MKVEKVEIAEDGYGTVEYSYKFCVQAVDNSILRKNGRMAISMGTEGIYHLLVEQLEYALLRGNKKERESMAKRLPEFLPDLGTIMFLRQLGIKATPVEVKDGCVLSE